MMEKEILQSLFDIKLLLKELVDKTSIKSNTHNTFAFSTAGSNSFHKDVHELLALPRGYYINTMTIVDIGGGFTFKINGETEGITAIKNMKISDEEIRKIELIPATSAGTAKIRFGAYIYNDK